MLKNNKCMCTNILSVAMLFLILGQNNMSAQIVIEKQSAGKVQLWIEAEEGNLSTPMRLFESESASGGQFMEVDPGNNNLEYAPEDGLTQFHFSVKIPGIYKIWGRVRIDMDDEDAFWVKMDDNQWVLWQDIEVGCQFHWDEVHDSHNNKKVMLYNLAAGLHTLTFTYGMDQSRLDKLLITNDLDYVPSGIGPRTAARFDFSPKTPIVDENMHFDGTTSLSTEGKIVAYDWNFGDGSTAKGQTATHIFNKTGVYQVRLIVTDDTGLTGRLTKSITIYSKNPISRFIYSPDRAQENEVITFDGTPSFDPRGKIVKYRWDFGDGTRGKEAKVKHQYTSAGEYKVTLQVTNQKRQKASQTRLVTIITGVPKRVILETDMCLDVDDVGALAVLHALANNNEAELLAVCYNEAHPFAASAIDAINTWYGRGDIPVGIYKKPLSDPDFSPYLEPCANFPNDLNRENAPSAQEVYHSVLSEQPDNSVTIISVGFLNNLSDLLNEYPTLVARKVKELVIMGGVHNDGFNLSRHNLVTASENVICNWPTPLVISQAGGNILTGQGLVDSPLENPVRESYYKFFHNNYCGRPSWDQMAVLYGVRGLSDYFALITTGEGVLSNGYKWRMEPGRRAYLKTLLPAESYAKIIQDLMLELPKK